MKKKTKRKWIILAVSVYMVCIGIPICVFTVDSLVKTNKTNQYLESLKQEAIEYLNTTPEMIEKFDEDISPQVTDIYCKYLEQYRKTSFFDLRPSAPDTLSEFERMLEKVVLHIDVKNKGCCVIFEQTESGTLEISNWYWDE